MAGEIVGIQEGSLPKFVGIATLENGAVIIRGGYEASLSWLESRINGISSCEGARFKVVGLDELQKRYRAAA